MKNYPAVFAKGTIFESFPFLLPNLVCASVVVFSLVIGILFLDETHSQKKHRRDPGREAGSWLVAKFQSWLGQGQSYSKLDELIFEEDDALIPSTPPPGYASAGSSPRLCATRSKSFIGLEPSETTLDRELPLDESPKSIHKIFTSQVIFHIIAYGILAL